MLAAFYARRAESPCCLVGPHTLERVWSNRLGQLSMFERNDTRWSSSGRAGRSRASRPACSMAHRPSTARRRCLYQESPALKAGRRCHASQGTAGYPLGPDGAVCCQAPLQTHNNSGPGPLWPGYAARIERASCLGPAAFSCPRHERRPVCPLSARPAATGATPGEVRDQPG